VRLTGWQGRPWVFVALFAVGLGACSDWSEDLKGWELVWSDEFDGPEGQLPDPRWWNFDVGTDWGNQQLEYDTDRPENASLDGNGNLAITARRESFMGRSYTSARITTAGRFEQAYGKFSARIKLPLGQGYWPAFWLLGSDFETVGWPQSGEIDVMEYRGQEPTVVHGTVHGPGYSAGRGVSARYAIPSGRLDDDFHVYSVEWEEGVIRWYLDDELFHVVTRTTVQGRGDWVFDHPFYIILNVAIGGTFSGGAPTPDVRFPQSMLVDWIRVYEQAR
jgi:beta-glucanase (GH16 family)